MPKFIPLVVCLVLALPWAALGQESSGCLELELAKRIVARDYPEAILLTDAMVDAVALSVARKGHPHVCPGAVCRDFSGAGRMDCALLMVDPGSMYVATALAEASALKVVYVVDANSAAPLSFLVDHVELRDKGLAELSWYLAPADAAEVRRELGGSNNLGAGFKLEYFESATRLYYWEGTTLRMAYTAD